MKKIFALSFLFVFLTSNAFAGTVNLPQTGQTTCYDTAGSVIPCAGTGQDGEIQAGVAWPEPRFIDNGNDTMTDNLTGLMWAKNGNLYNENMIWYQALIYCDNLTIGGYTDWRLSNVNELESLINTNEADNAIWLNTQGFTNVQASNYWSSTTDAYSTDYAWLVNMWVGYMFGCGKYDCYSYFWPVRGEHCGSFVDSVICLPQTGQKINYCNKDDGALEMGIAWPTPRFADHENGTVTDNLTGLMWTKDADLSNDITWQPALDYVKGMNAGTYENFGYTDWRLPNRKELRSLIDYSQYHLALPVDHPFTNTQGDGTSNSHYYWSSTSDAENPKFAWFVYISDGGMSKSEKSYYYHVWPVRAGQVQTPGCSTWTDVITKYNAYVSGQAVWNDVIMCYTQYTSS